MVLGYHSAIWMLKSRFRREEGMGSGLCPAYFLLPRLRRPNSTATNTTAIAITATNINIVLSLAGLTGMTAPIVNPLKTPPGAGKFEAA